MDTKSRHSGRLIRKAFSLLTCLMVLAGLLAPGILIKRPVYAQTPAIIPDANLKMALYQACGLDPDQVLYKEHLGELTGSLDLSGKHIASLEGIEAAVYLESLDASDNPLSSLPAKMKEMFSLSVLWLDDCQFSKIPAQIGELPILQTLSMKNNKITDISGINGSLFLSDVYLNRNRIASIPKLSQPPPLKNLHLSDNRLTEVPSWIMGLTTLISLDISGNRLVSLPPGLGSMMNLKELRADRNAIRSIPAELGAGGLRLLSLAENKLTGLPAHLFDSSHLIVLDVGCNRMTKIPSGADKIDYDTLVLIYNFIDFSDGSPNQQMINKIDAFNKAYVEQLTPIQGLAATATEDEVMLTWEPCPDHVYGSKNSGLVKNYMIYQEEKGTQTLLETVDPDTTQYKVTGLNPDMDYLFWVGVAYEVNMFLVYDKATTSHFTAISIRTRPQEVPTSETTEVPEPTEATTIETELSQTTTEAPVTGSEPETETKSEETDAVEPILKGPATWLYVLLGAVSALALVSLVLLALVMLKRGKKG